METVSLNSSSMNIHGIYMYYLNCIPFACLSALHIIKTRLFSLVWSCQISSIWVCLSDLPDWIV